MEMDTTWESLWIIEQGGKERKGRIFEKERLIPATIPFFISIVILIIWFIFQIKIEMYIQVFFHSILSIIFIIVIFFF